MNKKTTEYSSEKDRKDDSGMLDEVPSECEVCLEPSERLLFDEETKEWVCLQCNNDMKNEMRLYEEHFSYSHRYYMSTWDEDQDN